LRLFLVDFLPYVPLDSRLRLDSLGSA